jgi:hypothetical protein
MRSTTSAPFYTDPNGPGLPRPPIEDPPPDSPDPGPVPPEPGAPPEPIDLG